MKALHSVLAVGLAAYTTACDPAADFDGTVRNADGSPAASAAIEIGCKQPSGFPDKATTDSSGRFEVNSLGCIPRSCPLRVRARDGKTAEYTAGKYCTGKVSLGCRERDFCNHVKLDVVLPK